MPGRIPNDATVSMRFPAFVRAQRSVQIPLNQQARFHHWSSESAADDIKSIPQFFSFFKIESKSALKTKKVGQKKGEYKHWVSVDISDLDTDNDDKKIINNLHFIYLQVK